MPTPASPHPTPIRPASGESATLRAASARRGSTDRSRRAPHGQVSEFRQLTDRVTAVGLMRRRHRFYWTAFGACLAVLAGSWAGVVELGDSWWALLPAAVLGLVFAQLGFLAHEACHRQVFRSARWNDWAGRVVAGLLVGISPGWWTTKHSRHHAAPNQLSKDPDIDGSPVAFHADAAQERRAAAGWLVRRQGRFFLPLLALEGLSLHVSSVRRVLSRQPLKHRRVEIAFLAVRLLGYLTVVFWLFPPGLAAAFVGVQTVVFGFLLGGAFAPNHIGMPIVPRDLSIDFLRRQVLMSRNISGGPLVRFLMGGLETQVEHHLFPAMPRPNLRQAQAIVRAYCHEHHIAYTETSLRDAYRSVLSHLNQVGLKHRDTFQCPLTQHYRV